MKVLVFDLETSVKSEKSIKASPFWDENQVVAVCSMDILFERGSEPRIVETKIAHISDVGDAMKNALDTLAAKIMTYDMVVGHNIPFDLAYVAKHNPNIFTPSLQIWDTKVVQHVILGHQGKWTLDDLCRFYGLTTKDDKIRRFWEDGYDTEDIPKEELLEYCYHDVKQTMTIFLKQLDEIEDRGLHRLVLRRNASRLATANIQWNGMFVNTDSLEHLSDRCTKLKDEAKSWWLLKANLIADDLFDLLDLNPGSINDMTLLLYGGSKVVRVKEPVLDADGEPVLYKSGLKKGQVRTKYKERFVELPRRIPGKGVDDHRLKEIEETTSDAVVRDLCRFTRDYRTQAKALGTYLAGMIKHIFPDSRIHSSYHHHITRTGRLSSSSPNLQNVTASTVKTIFTPRKNDSVFVEIDFNQLELRCVAVLSKDAQLLLDIRDDVDIHRQLAAQLFGKEPEDVTDSERRMAKRGTFQLLYGAGAPSIAKQWNMPVKLARGFIDTFFNRYPSIQKWRDTTASHVKANMTKTRVVRSQFNTPYKYDEDPTFPGHSRYTQIINYPVQGLAAEVVHIALDKLYRMVHHYRWRKSVKLVNCVHDSFLFEVESKEHLAFLEELSKLINTLSEEVSRQLDINFCLPLKYEAKTGLDWYNMEKDI